MLYTVHEVAKLSGVTIKTLYHYQKIGLLMPKKIAENGYRYYGDAELERLQQILFYRELDFSLDKIKEALQDEPSRLRCLCDQKSLLIARRQRSSRILQTLDEAIICARKGVTMSKDKIFTGLNEQEWEDALAEQSEYLKREYGYDMPVEEAQPEQLNEDASQAKQFMFFMAEALKNNVAPDDETVTKAIKKHIAYVNKGIHPADANSFMAETKFFLTDAFHRSMYENLQTGLAYYVFTAATMYAENQNN